MKNDASGYHVPVMPEEVLRFLAPQPGEIMLDGTLGGGGHSRLLAEKLRPGGTLIGLDRDADALTEAAPRLEAFAGSLSIILKRTAFGKLENALAELPGGDTLKLDGVLFDLGVSSHQLDTERGFSFRRDERLDMRMDADSGLSAADLLETISESEFTRILWEYGDERWAKRIAGGLQERRAKGDKIETTAQLAALVESRIPRAAWPKDTHVATRTFQAVRIAVNDELGQLEAGLRAGIQRLRAGGRIVVLSYHSLEDRIVKQIFAEQAGRTPSAPGSSPAAFLPVSQERTVELLTRKPVLPTDAEIAQNHRARSARIRAARRLDE